MSDLRSKMLRIASGLPQGDTTRRKLLAALKGAASDEEKQMVADVAKKLRAKPSGHLGTRMDLSNTHRLTLEKDPRGSEWAATIRLKGEKGTASEVASETWSKAPSVADVVQWVKKQRL
jgi:hypothetical protein